MSILEIFSGKKYMFFITIGPLPRDIPYRRPSTPSLLTPPTSPAPSVTDTDSESESGKYRGCQQLSEERVLFFLQIFPGKKFIKVIYIKSNM